MRSTNSPSRRIVTVLKRLVEALMALIGGLLIVAIGLFILGFVAACVNPNIISSQKAVDRFFMAPLLQTYVIIYFTVIAAAPIWLIFYLPCHLLIRRSSVLWRPWLCIPLGAVAGAAAFWGELSFITRGANLNTGIWILNDAILAACVGGCTCLVGSVIVKRSREREKRTLVVGSEQR
jgi:hypothetical protein